MRVRCEGEEFTQWDTRKARHDLPALRHQRLDLVQDGQHLLLLGDRTLDDLHRQTVIDRFLRVRILKIEINREQASLFVTLDQVGGPNTFQACVPSLRSGHQARQSANSSYCSG